MKYAHMFHLGRDLAKGKLQEIAAAHLGTGDYVLGPRFKSRHRARDVEKATTLLEKLGAVLT